MACVSVEKTESIIQQQFGMNASQFRYHIPARLIAQSPAVPRDSAKLLVYDRSSKKVKHDVFKNLADHLPGQSVLVVNETKVIPARLPAQKPTGGIVKLLLLDGHGFRMRALVPGTLAEKHILTVNKLPVFRVLGREHSWVVLRPLVTRAILSDILTRFGNTPIPPYIKHSPLSESRLRKEYQAVFARHTGSVAAPTASLHFTNRLLVMLQRSGHPIVPVTLHVNLGTFAPVTAEQIRSRRLHEEFYTITKRSAQAIRNHRTAGHPIIAVGTTVVRALESAGDAQGRIRASSGTTRLFIQPGYRFRVVDGLITNFHVPQSSLMMLVAAFTGRPELLRIYRIAIQKRYRFFSFGDGMLIV